jgi:hypothetical protein
MLPVIAALPAPPMMGDTCRLYRAKNGREFLLVADTYLEYASGYTLMRTPWDNIKSLTNGWTGCYLLLRRPSIIPANGYDLRNEFNNRVIPLGPFHYTDNSPLARDLRRFAPHLFYH